MGDAADFEADRELAWRRPAPRARALAMTLYGWQEPGWVFLFAILAASPFIAAALFAPALLSLSPTVEMLAPIADARAVMAGAAAIPDQASPFFLFLLSIADLFTDTPGRTHLVARALLGILIIYPTAYACAARFPVIQTVVLTVALAAYTTAPFAGVTDLALAIFLALAIILVCAPADESRDRARFEGIIAGAMLTALWTLSPIFFLTGVMALSACPFLTGRAGLDRYFFTIFTAGALVALSEVLVPGLSLARAHAASGVLTSGTGSLTSGAGAWGLAGIAVSSTIVLASSAIFGGRDHARGWAAGLVFLIISFAAARIAGANTMPLFALACAMACLSVASPFYDGIFRDHDRASVALAGAAATLTLFWTTAIVAQGAGQVWLQHQVARAAPLAMRAELGLVQPGGPTIARWVEEGRFSTPEARQLFALTPIDQSTMLLEVAARAERLAAGGLDVAILTGADTACVIASRRPCRPDGRRAADEAKVVFVPRLDLDARTSDIKKRSEGMLYTDFKLAERTPLWEVWVRRGITLPAEADLNLIDRGLVDLGGGL